MPYIRRDVRSTYKPTTPKPLTHPGALNFAITSLISDYMDAKPWSYFTMNEILGVLEAAKQEFYRRVMVPYEDEKIKQNGDVYPERG